MDSRVVLLLLSVSPFTRPVFLRRATPGLLLPAKRRRPRQPSPHHRVTRALSPVAYRRDLPTTGRWRASPVMVQDHFLQAAARITVIVRDRHSARSIPGRGFGAPSALPPGAVFGAPSRPKCRLPKSPCLAPSSTSLLRHSRWLVTGCLPPLKVAKFEQRVLYGRGPAQVGFGVLLSSFRSLTLSSGGILSPEPLRLTHPEGAVETSPAVHCWDGKTYFHPRVP
jgi:hypothetical protein